jgi:CPA2 family monovalent cation:H+ antiporter-2
LLAAAPGGVVLAASPLPAVLAVTTDDVALAFVELGLVALALAVLARLASRFGITAIPLYLLAGLAVGEGGIVRLDVSEDVISLAAEIGILLLLLTLGLEYTSEELMRGLRTTSMPAVVDAVANFTPGFLLALALGWDVTAAVLLGGVTWVSSSGVVAKVLADLDRLGNRETPAILNLLVMEDLAMAVYLPIAAALVADRGLDSTVAVIAVALVAVVAILWSAVRFGPRLSDLIAPGNDEAVVLTVFGMTLLVAGLAQQVQVSAAIGAFLVGLALGGTVQPRAIELIRPLRDLFAATFFLFFSFQIDPASLLDVAWAALLLAVVTAFGKLVSGWVAARSYGVAVPGRLRAGTTLVAHGEFSIVVAALGASLADGEQLGALAAGFVLVTAVLGPVATKYSDRIPLPGFVRAAA